MQKRFEICPTDELAPGEREIVDLDGMSVGVFNIGGEYHALKNDCPHQRAPLCEGKVTGTTSATSPGDVTWEDEGRVLRCPWHGWEFDIETGRSVFNPHRVRARSFEATVEESDEVDDKMSDGSLESEATNGGVHCDECGSGVDDTETPPVETYKVTVEDKVVVVYL